MAAQDINIRLQMKDELTPVMKGVQQNLDKLQANFKQFGLGLRQVGREISSVGSSLTMLGTTITAPLLLAFKTAAEHSAIASRAVWELQNVFQNLQITIGEGITPIIKNFTDVIGNLVDRWKALTPEVRDHIVQTIFLVGQYVLVAGVLTLVSGRLLTMIANTALLSEKLIGFISWIKGASAVLFGLNIPMIVVIGTIGGVIYAMMKWKQAGDTVMNGLQISFNTIALLWSGLKVSILAVLDVVTNAMAKLLELGGHLPDKFGGAWFKGAAAGARELADTLHSSLLKETENVSKKVAEMQQLFNKIASGNNGSWAQGFDNMKSKLANLKNGLKDLTDFLHGKGGDSPKSTQSVGNFFTGFQLGLEQTYQKLSNWADAGKKTAEDMARAMQQSFSNFFFDAFTGQLKTAQDYFRAFGENILRMMSDLVAQLIAEWALVGMLGIGGGIGGGRGGGGGGGGGIFGGLLSMLGGLFGGGGAVAGAAAGAAEIYPGVAGLSSALLWLHQGGQVKRAHSGTMLGQDEVPIIAQAGEGIISRRGMGQLGKGNFDRINRGDGSGQSGTTNHYYYIMANDSKSFSDQMIKNKATIHHVVEENVRANGTIRKTMQAYA